MPSREFGDPRLVGSVPLRPTVQAALMRRCDRLLERDEEVARVLHGDLFATAFDGYVCWRAQGLLITTQRRTFFISSPRAGWLRLQQTTVEFATPEPGELLELPGWQAAPSGPTYFLVTDLGT